MTVPAIASLVRVSVARLTINSANPDTTTPITIEPKVMDRSKAIGIGRCSANMPMKCMDQMPVPMAKAPPINQ